MTGEETAAATVREFCGFAEPELDLEDVCLEVRAGAADVARTLARRVRHITALDEAADALLTGKRKADREALTNITFQRGDAAALPYLDRTFTLLLCHDALSTAIDPGAVLRELVRVARPGAGIVVSDPGLTEADLRALVLATGAEIKRSATSLSRAFVHATAP
ncbi:methyltransferase domain-containing protein [Actinocorallia sp. API 0066]|uniref:class I SAM-dependent methyltransferase n=1 Tax=Actinocorallia sp. API 0066 TaxID=2896846 RepID=UPI001E34BB2E|nr:methyltransferase domain-containing protein [Actinocorallia sp. API 0066]MCD0448093.1 methyltransferase domain-containing protein [Actinocorallia sp. API 0066]